MKIKDFFIFCRWKNILMIILTQILIKYVLFQKFDLSTSLSHLDFFILTLTTVLIAAAGYIINDINDIKTDLINKPAKVFVSKKISEKNASNLYVLLNSAGLLMGFYLSYAVDKVTFFAIFIITSLLLYNYAIYLKKKLLIGNLTISFVVFLSIILVPLFDIVPATNTYNSSQQYLAFYPVFVIACFAFLLTFLREIVKDAEDLEGDKKIKAKTIPITFGIKKTNQILQATSILILLFIGYFTFILCKTKIIAGLYSILFLAIPILYFIWKIRLAIAKENYHKLSNFLKIIMLLGILIQFFL
jgi:4-hydroxybenzoate polyprenyltransferase